VLGHGAGQGQSCWILVAAGPNSAFGNGEVATGPLLLDPGSKGSYSIFGSDPRRRYEY